MWSWSFQKLGPRYILLIMLVTRLVGGVGGVLTIYYVNLTLVPFPSNAGEHFNIAALLAVLGAVIATMCHALLITRNLRGVLRKLQRHSPVGRSEGMLAVREAVLFVSRQVSGEVWLVPVVTTVPVCIYLGLTSPLDQPALYHIAIATGLGIALSLMFMYFIIERAMVPVSLHLLELVPEIDFDELPKQSLRFRMHVGFAAIIICTALMISALSQRRALDIVAGGGNPLDAVMSLRSHTFYISVAALVVGLAYSHLLASLITSRVGRMVSVMKRVQQGEFDQRLHPTGTDEIDTLARQFNRMVGELEQKDRTVRDLNANLERKVRLRTGELARSKRFLQESLERLRESDRHKTEFFSNISHELRTPLMMILSPIEQLHRRAGGSLSRESQALLNVAEVNAQRLLRLINQLLEFARIEAGHAQLEVTSVDVNRLVERLAAASRPLVEQRGLKLLTQLTPGLPSIAADREKLDIVLTNLISNAIKFTPRDGTIWISTELISPGNSVFDRELVRVSVDDTGVGIDPANFDRLFERFVQVDGSTSREFAGTGLGLALVKEYVELHEGSLEVQSQPGSGSRFSFLLPVGALEVNAVSDSSSQLIRAERFSDLQECDLFVNDTGPLDATAAHGEGNRKNGTILVVDDMAEVRRMVGAILSERYRVLYGRDGGEALEVIGREEPDLIISDVMMPGIDGYELCRRVKQDPNTAGIPFVLLTARAKGSMKIEGLKCGAEDYLVKPFDAEELLARVRSLLRLREMHKEVSEHNDQLADALSQLRRAQDQLIQSEKMNSLGQLVAGLAHEINNSINAVYNGIPSVITRTERLQQMVDAALDDAGTDGTERRQQIDASFNRIRTLADVIEEGAVRTARIVGDMKSFAHPGSETHEQFDLNHALDLCANLLDKQFRERVRIHRDFGDIPPVCGPRGQLNQVFLNLLTNAVQAMPEGGDIFVSTAVWDGEVRVSIRDTGPGIPDALRHRIFDPFFTTKPVGTGTGLGLTISYGIIKKAGGRIECRSQEGIGTTFVITLPLGPEVPSRAVETAVAAASVETDPDACADENVVVSQVN